VCRIVLYLHPSEQVYICVILEVPYCLKRKQSNQINKVMSLSGLNFPFSGVLGKENTCSGCHTACTYIYSSRMLHVYRQLKNSHNQMLYSFICIVNFNYTCRKCLLMINPFIPYCIFDGVFLRYMSQYFVLVLIVCIVS
jgi:hypothetical protein